jgi:hypothetical protein
VVAYLVALPQTHSQFTLICKLPSAPVGAHFFFGFVLGLGFGFWTEGHDCFLRCCACGARRGCVKGFAEWGFLDAGEGLGLEFRGCGF